MTTTIRDINELQDRRIMMEKKLPPFGYALILLTAALILFLVVWSTKNYRTYVSQSSGSVQAANKTYIMSSYSGSITELNIAEGTYVNEGDLIAHIKSTDLDMQQDSIQSQLDIYKKQKSQYEKLQKNTLTQMQTIERQQKRIAQLEESLAMALSENGQLRDLTEELMKQRNELEESLTGVKSSARPLVTALNSLGLSVSEVD